MKWVSKTKKNWLRLATDYDYLKEPSWPRYLLPAIAWTLWHKIHMPTAPYEIWTTSLQFEFWWWRLRVIWGKHIDIPKERRRVGG